MLVMKPVEARESWLLPGPL